MNVIDYRILVQATAETVWQIVSDIKRNPEWQVNCKAVSILTNANQGGPGMSWRATSDSGKDYVVRVTAWYDRIGYEYTFTDGTPYKDSKGQIRLQETPEGTLVQWTFQYDMPGVIGGLKNSLGRKRAIEKDIIDSLQNLYKLMSRTTTEKRFESKALIREAPDVRARQQYKPRHPSIFDQTKEDGDVIQPAASTESARETLNPFAYDPPKADDDTRPHPVVKREAAPDVVEDKSEASSAPAASTGNDPISIFRPPEAPASAPAEPTQVQIPVEQPPAAAEPAQPQPPAMDAPAKPAEETSAPIPPVGVDTAAVSVFDLFGIPRPSATQESKAVKVEAEPEAPASTPQPVAEEAIAKADTPESVPAEATVKVDAPIIPEAPETASAAPESAPDTAKPIEAATLSVLEIMPRYGRVGLRYKLRYLSVKLRRP